MNLLSIFPVKRTLKMVRKKTTQEFHVFKFFLIKIVSRNEILKQKKIQVGCGDIKLANFINIDFRPTKATDLTMNCADLSYFPKNSISLIYANAFFEHLYVNERSKALKSYVDVLRGDGMLIILALPDFEEIAKAYLTKKPGVFAKTFDAQEVYRLTHGDPEQAPTWWLQQLHKSIFDKKTVAKLLIDAGFKNYVIFNYHYRDIKLDVNLGFVAVKNKARFQINKKWLQENLSTLNPDVNVNSIKISKNITKN